MKVAFICKSDAAGGAAVVTFRLMNALRKRGVDARMIVADKLTDSPYVICAAPRWKRNAAFIAERSGIFLKNGLNRKRLFMIDTASSGLRIDKIPFVREADVVCLNWVNQGMLSFKGIDRIYRLGHPVVWTMHDMWNMTGVCHHAGYCREYLAPDGECRDCPLLEKAFSKDLSHQVWRDKCKLYKNTDIHFVAVSNWLAGCARKSSLMKDCDIRVIPNAFPVEVEESRNLDTDNNDPCINGGNTDGKITVKKKIIFGAARIDDPIKGHETLVEATKILTEKYPRQTADIELITFGNLKNPHALDGIGIPHTHLGPIPPSEISDIYRQGCVVVSTSEWETLPGTLVEGQAWGCVPVALDHGGQGDIIEHCQTGYLAPWHDADKKRNALGIAEGIIWGIGNYAAVRDRMRESVIEKFSERAVASSYLHLFSEIIKN